MLIHVYNRVYPMDKNAMIRLTRFLTGQLNLHLAPAWNLPPKFLVEAGSLGGKPDAALYLVDRASVPGALGNHAQNHAGKPAAWVFLDIIKETGTDLLSVCSHEICEMAVNPKTDKWAKLVLNGKEIYEPLEVCDLVQGRSYTFGLDQLSDFVFPSAFDASLPGPRSYMASVGAAPDIEVGTPAPGGYCSVYDPETGEVTQVFADQVAKDRYAAKMALPNADQHMRALRLSKPVPAVPPSIPIVDADLAPTGESS